jgi:large subunit ribosomal protein L10
MKTKRHNPIPERKIKAVKELANLINKKKTILIASIKNLPASQYQEIGKKLRGRAVIKVPKKNILFRAIDSSENKEASQLKECFETSTAILFSDLDSYDLAAELLKSKSPAKAKPGQIAPEDIEVQAGPTDLLPGPAISELGAVGLKIQIEKGKITIKESKVIVKQGQEISQAASDIMNKLDIKPFSIGFVPLCAFDNEIKKLYLEMKIDSEEVIESIKNDYGRALAFAVEIGYVNSDTITFMLNKAGAYEKTLAALIKTEAPAEVKEKAKIEEPTQTPEESKSESPEASKDSKESSGEEK